MDSPFSVTEKLADVEYTHKLFGQLMLKVCWKKGCMWSGERAKFSITLINGEELRENIEEEYPNDDKRDVLHSEHLMLGFVQLSGWLSLNKVLKDVDLSTLRIIGNGNQEELTSDFHGGGIIGVSAKLPEEVDQNVKAEAKRGLLDGVRQYTKWAVTGKASDEIKDSDNASSTALIIPNSSKIRILFAAPKILFVDLPLKCSSSRTFSYEVDLPHGLPPSYKGGMLRINYWIEVGVQRKKSTHVDQSQENLDDNNHEMVCIRIPLGILGSKEMVGSNQAKDISPKLLFGEAARVSEESKPKVRNGCYGTKVLGRTGLMTGSREGFTEFLRKRIKEDTYKADDDMQNCSTHNQITGLTRKPKCIKITREGKLMSEVHVNRNVFKLGDMVRVRLDTRKCEMKILQFTASLVTLESIIGSITERKVNLNDEDYYEKDFKVWTRSLSYSMIFAQAKSIVLCIPLYAIPQFIAGPIAVNWAIRLHFTILRGKSLTVDESPTQVHHESDSFDVNIPIHVHSGAIREAVGVHDTKG